jgi:UDP-N-acetylmuramoyl-tripeptide--D-alanyl-D-alanine ligase
MQKITCEEVLEATGGILISGDRNSEFLDVYTDSRRIEKGGLFIPIIGERFDGHDFIKPSLDAGAEGIITSREIEPVKGKVVIKVYDTLNALGRIAAFYRQKFDIPFVGITGSVGKTSTKDMVAGVLSQKFNVLKTHGNYNNEIGLPLTIFKLDCFHEAAVIEMGMSGLGEISRLTSIARPDIAVITNIGLSHIEKLGSRQNILKAKLEILEGLNPDGVVILNGDDELLSGTRDLLKFRTVFYGMRDGVDYQAYNIKTDGEKGIHFEVMIRNREYSIHVPVPGIHNVHNALAALATGMELNIGIEKIIKGINEFVSGKMRLNILSHNGIKLIDDAYNASPQSMKAAISVLKDISDGNRTVAVLGDMLEMGEWALEGHITVGKYVADKGIDFLITLGENAKNIAQGAVESGLDKERAVSFDRIEDINIFLGEFLKKGDVVLIKGSRGMKMEEIVSYLKNNYGLVDN